MNVMSFTIIYKLNKTVFLLCQCAVQNRRKEYSECTFSDIITTFQMKIEFPNISPYIQLNTEL